MSTVDMISTEGAATRCSHCGELLHSCNSPRPSLAASTEWLNSLPPMPPPLTESDVRRIVREELASKNSWLIERRPDSGEADV